ncbi:hypothetical protein CRENPOLYSF2_2150017 [Crenothrix polyspora]|uniref:Uncharacterized protein n=1 Tax=Crenothrix polyspora TaxID=360316 RepID=A0A1R4H522_9GAMM|nr:hypothetical protein CRENPOLYSF2_2150017 [Crenothrix polyspora]
MFSFLIINLNNAIFLIGLIAIILTALLSIIKAYDFIFNKIFFMLHVET